MVGRNCCLSGVRRVPGPSGAVPHKASGRGGGALEDFVPARQRLISANPWRFRAKGLTSKFYRITTCCIPRYVPSMVRCVVCSLDIS